MANPPTRASIAFNALLDRRRPRHVQRSPTTSTFDRLGIQPARAGKLEWAVIFLLPFGALLLPIAGWVLGVWASRVWSTREKLVGTLLVPGA